jgi:hypothetical protein
MGSLARESFPSGPLCIASLRKVYREEMDYGSQDLAAVMGG